MGRICDFFRCCLPCCPKKHGYSDMDEDQPSKRDATKNEIRELRRKVEKLVSDLREEKQAKDRAINDRNEALTRLSEHVALKLADNNPNLVDLSDINRPNNLVDKFSQLYDNEWTSAFECLTEKHKIEDRESINLLLEIVMECFRICREKAATQLEMILKAFHHDMDRLSTESKKILKDARKKVAPEAVYFFLEEIRDSLIAKDQRLQELLTEKEMQDYLKNCVKLCCLMSVQDPPMALSANVGADTKYSKSKYREYLTAGEFVDYFVWPCVFIQDGDSQMAPGIVECCDAVREQSVTIGIDKEQRAF